MFKALLFCNLSLIGLGNRLSFFENLELKIHFYGWLMCLYWLISLFFPQFSCQTEVCWTATIKQNNETVRVGQGSTITTLDSKLFSVGQWAWLPKPEGIYVHHKILGINSTQLFHKLKPPLSIKIRHRKEKRQKGK